MWMLLEWAVIGYADSKSLTYEQSINMSEKKGFIAINRGIFEHEFYNEQREFSRFEAWLDLIQLSAFEENNTMLHRGRVIKWGRGQTIASVRYLQSRWSWKSTDKVFRFLELLRSQDMIRTEIERGIQRITLCKYDYYNGDQNKKRTQNRTVAEQSQNELKEYKEFKQNREAREKLFFDSLVPYVGQYGKAMVRAFYNHWSEWHQKRDKMKWEMEETWELQKRLATWAARQKDFVRRPEPEKPKESIIPKASKQLIDKFEDYKK